MSSERGLSVAVMNGNSLNRSGSCTACGKKSDRQCSRCCDIYCSEECQRKDWQSHRYICFPMPKLVEVGQPSSVEDDIPKLERKNENSSPNTKQLPSGSCVFLTSFKSTNLCYVRSTNPSSVAELEKVLNEVNEFGKKSSVLSEKPKIGSHALALRCEKWCRVQILRLKENAARVMYIDGGDIADKSFKELRKSRLSINNLPCFVHLVRLKGITNYSFEQKYIKQLYQFVNKEYRIDYVEPDNTGGNVELYQWGTTTLLNSIIQELSDKDNGDHSIASSSSNVGEPKTNPSPGRRNEKNKKSENNKSNIKVENEKNKVENKRVEPSSIQNSFGKSTEDTKSSVRPATGENSIANGTRKNSSAPRQIQLQKHCLIPPFEIIPLTEIDHSCKILIMDNSFIEDGYIGCLLEKYYENLASLTAFLNEYKPSDEPYKPKFNEYCIAKFDDIWYRAKTVDVISEDKFLVVYIDFTNEKELSSESIRPYPLSLNNPCYTTMCLIDGLPDNMTEELKSFLERNCAAFSFLNVDSIRIENNNYYVKSSELLKKLRDSFAI